MKKLTSLMLLLIAQSICLYGSISIENIDYIMANGESSSESSSSVSSSFNSSSDCSIDLQAAINTISATSPFDVTINICGTYVGNFYVPQPTYPITITLEGEHDCPTLDGNGTGTVLTVLAYARVELKNLKITNGLNATFGGGILNLGIMVIDHCSITDNIAYQAGGGIFNQGAAAGFGVMNIYNSDIENNFTYGNGGGIYNVGAGLMVIKDSCVCHNTAAQGSGGGIGNSTGAYLFIDDTSVHKNTAGAYGGGIDNADFVVPNTNGTVVLASTLYVKSSGVRQNTALLGGGISNKGKSNLKVFENSHVTYNTATNTGGGIYNTSTGLFVVDDSEVEHNSPNQIAP